MSKVVVQKIHPTRSPDSCVISGVREGGGLGFWVGPDIDVVGSQIVTPHVSVRMAKQWLEDSELVVDVKEYERLQQELEARDLEIEELERVNAQYHKRLTRVYGPRKQKATA